MRKSHKTKAICSLMLVASIFSSASPEVSAKENGEGAYIGGGIGSSNWKSSVSSNNYTSSGVHIFGGYQLNPILALEAEYFDLGSINVPLPIAGNPSASIKASGIGLSGIGLVPFANGKLDFFAKMGIASISTTATAPAGYVFTAPASNKNTGMSLGLGLNFNYTRNIILRLSADRYECSIPSITNTIKIDLYGISGVYHF